VYRKGPLFGERGEARSATALAERDRRDDCARRRGPRVRRWVGRGGGEEQDTRREFAEFWLGEHTSGHYRSLST